LFKFNLLYTKQYEYMLTVSKYKLVLQRPFTPKNVGKPSTDVPVVKQKAPAAKKDKEGTCPFTSQRYP
jgi:hypothetical protein